MKTTMTKILMTASVLTIVAASAPAMANPSVLCSVRANYEAAGTGAAYTPGVDVDGNAVAPADTTTAPMPVANALMIPLTVDLAQRMNEVLPDDAKLETEVGVVEVRQNGQVIINGKDLTAPATSMCSTIEKQKEAALKTKDAPKKPKVVKPAEPVVEEPAVTEPAVAEPAPAEAPVVEQPAAEAAPTEPAAPDVAETPAPAEPTPQVLEPAPATEAAPAADATLAAPTPDQAAPVPEGTAPAPTTELVPADPAVAVPPAAEVVPPPADGSVPVDEQGVPRPPMDPLAGNVEPPPAPEETMSGGAQ